MRFFLIILFSFSCTISIFSQTARDMRFELEGKWSLDENGNVTIIKIVELPELSKEQIYSRALQYFTYNYVSGKDVIQIQDEEKGLIVGKGLFVKVHVGVSLNITQFDVWHILRIDIKEGRARVIVSLTQYEKKGLVENIVTSMKTSKVSSEYPINKYAEQKTMMIKAFYYAFKRANKTINFVEKALKEGSISKDVEDNDW